MGQGRHRTVIVAIAMVAGCGPGISVDGQELHPAKAVFDRAQDWDPTSVAEISLPAFRPFRAVYERFYNQGLGPRAGELRQDWVVVTADLAAWDDREAIVVSLYDTGNPIYPDTNGRAWTAYLDRETLELFLEVGPIPGAAKDYYVWRQTGDGMAGGMLRLESQEADFREQGPDGGPGIGIGPWALASLPLSPGMKMRLDPYHGVTANAFGAGPAVAMGQVPFEDPTGRVWDTWQVDQIGNPSSPNVTRLHLIPEPPYLVARYSHDLEDGTDSRGHRLVSFQYLELPPETGMAGSR